MHRRASATPSIAVTVALLAVIASLASCSSAPAPRSNTITLENAQPGTSSWQLTEKPSDDETRQIEGYASATSVDLGGQISFQVTVNPVQHYSIDIYRMGYYQGLGGRLVRHVDRLPGIRQPDCPLDRRTGLIACDWSAGYRLTLPQDWISGVYLAKLK